jgi:hypothetical protein
MMQRRDFLGTTCAAGAAALTSLAGAAKAADASPKEWLELRTYKVEAGPMRTRLETFLREAAIPALNRAGVETVGVFGPMDEKVADLVVLLPHKSIDAFAAASRKLLADADYQKAGAALLNPPKGAPTYARIESSLMLAFDAAPKVEVVNKKPTRVFQLRTYESFSDAKARKKIEMFNSGGEIALFRSVGMQPVFFGETIVGAKIPNLTYMLVFDDMDANKAAWDKFLKAPEWDKLKNDPQYADTVSNITNTLLKPAAFSQI